MTPETTNTTTSTQPPDFFYQLLGKTSAGAAEANPTSLPNSLNVAYGEFVKREANRNTERMRQYELEKESLVRERGEKNGERAALSVTSTHKQGEIEDKEKELATVRDETPKPNYAPIIISCVLLIGLTVFLFLLYSSNGYAALVSATTKVRPDGLIISKVFTKARREDLLLIILFFPVVFMVLGYVAHLMAKDKKIIQLVSIVCFTLMLDIMIAYKIAENLHKWDFEHTKTNVDWVWTMAFGVNVGIIIALGFIVYILWGFLLNKVLNELEKNRPKNLREAGIDLLKKQSLDLTKELADLKNQLTLADERLLQITAEIEQRDKKINTLKGGGMVVDIPALEGMVGKFMAGWQTAVTAMYAFKDSSEATLLVDQAIDVSDGWLTNKKKTFTL